MQLTLWLLFKTNTTILKILLEDSRYFIKIYQSSRQKLFSAAICYPYLKVNRFSIDILLLFLKLNKEIKIRDKRFMLSVFDCVYVYIIN